MDQNSTKIKPRLGQFDLTMIVVGLIIGMGIFRAPSEVAVKAGSVSVFFSAWVLGAVISLIGALTFAEIGSRFHKAGGFYKIFSYCYHPAFAFMVNWITVISNAASTAGVSIMGAEYIAPVLFPNTSVDISIPVISITSVALLYGVNMLGVKLSAKLLNVLMLIKLSLLLLLISAMFILDAPAASKTVAVPSPESSDWLKALILCFIPTFFTFGGYQQTINFGGDVKNPGKTIPRAVCYGIIIVLCVYLLANLSFVKTLGFDGLQKSDTLASDICAMLFGGMAAKLVSVVMFLSVMAYVNVSILSNPRIYYAMAEEKVLPSKLMQVNQKTQVQEWGVTLFCLFILATLFFSASFQKILEYVMFFDSISLITGAAAIFILRKKMKNDKKEFFRMPGYPVLPIIYIAIYSIVNISVLYANPNAAMWGMVLFVSGLPLYYGVKKLIRSVEV